MRRRLLGFAVVEQESRLGEMRLRIARLRPEQIVDETVRLAFPAGRELDAGDPKRRRSLVLAAPLLLQLTKDGEGWLRPPDPGVIVGQREPAAGFVDECLEVWLGVGGAARGEIQERQRPVCRGAGRVQLQR